MNAIPEQETYELLRVGPLAVQPELAGSTARGVHEGRNALRHPADAAVSDQITYGPNAEFLSTFLLQPSSPYYPTALAEAAGVGGQPLNLRYRAYALGLRDTTDENEALAGGRRRQGHRVRTGTSTSTSSTAGTRRARAATAASRGTRRSLPLLNSRARQSVRTAARRRCRPSSTRCSSARRRSAAKSTGYLFEGKATGDLFKLPAGSVAAAVGLPGRQAGARAALPSGAADRRRHGFRRQQPEHRRRSRLLGGVRRAQHSDRQERSSSTRRSATTTTATSATRRTRRSRSAGTRRGSCCCAARGAPASSRRR